MLSLVWASASFLAWFSGSTVLQARSRRGPIDPLLGVAVLSLTIIAFHVSASLSLTAPMATKAFAIMLIDLILVLLTMNGIRRRIHLRSPHLGPTMLILAGSISFWMWYIGWMGGLLPN